MLLASNLKRDAVVSQTLRLRLEPLADPVEAGVSAHRERYPAVVLSHVHDEIHTLDPVRVTRHHPLYRVHGLHLSLELVREHPVGTDDAPFRNERGDLRAGEALHELVPCGRGNVEFRGADVALVIAHVVLVERGVGRLRDHHHSLPPPKAVEVDPSLTTRARADILEKVALVGAVEAVSAQRLVLLVLLHSHAQNREGRQRAREHCVFRGFRQTSSAEAGGSFADGADIFGPCYFS